MAHYGPSVSLTKLAEIVNTIPQEAVREAMANHLAQQLNQRCNGFNASIWHSATGGKLTGAVQVALPETPA